MCVCVCVDPSIQLVTKGLVTQGLGMLVTFLNVSHTQSCYSHSSMLVTLLYVIHTPPLSMLVTLLNISHTPQC